MNFDEIKAIVAQDFDETNRCIMQNLRSDVPLIREMGEYIVNSGGKRLRPLISILSARACGYQGNLHINVATIIEYLHTATLLHDDVVDGSEMRRGRKTVNAVWGNQASVLVGDFLISRAFQMVVEVGDFSLMEILADGTNIISEGEVLQLINCRDPDTSEERYMQVIHAKTAKMFESAAETGAVLGAGNNADGARLKDIMGTYARHLGIAFQLVDDLLDYKGDASEMGKNVGDDLAEGKPTLPLIYVMQNGSEEEAGIIRNAIRNGGLGNLQTIIKIVQNSGGIDYTMNIAEKESRRAIETLADVPESEYKKALVDLARFSVNRSH